MLKIQSIFLYVGLSFVFAACHSSFKISKLRSLGKASGLRELFFRFTEREGESAERDIRFLRIIRAKWK